MPFEQQIIEAVRALAPDKQKAVLKFVESLQSGAESELPNSTDNSIDLASRGISPEQAADLRSRLKTITDDWNLPEMAAYDEL